MWRNARLAGLLLLVGIVAAGCTSAGGDDPTSTLAPVSSSTGSSTDTATTSSTSSVSPSSSPKSTPGSESVQSSPAEWPADLTPDQVAEAQAAIAAYLGYRALSDQALANPAAPGWDQEIGLWAADPEKTGFLNVIRGLAQLGQYAKGSFVVYPMVTKVEPGIVTMTVCSDSTNVGFFDQHGQSIKSPDQQGSYWRHPAEVQVVRYDVADPAHQWLVTFVTDDPSTAC